jgi:hypothetical protein
MKKSTVLGCAFLPLLVTGFLLLPRAAAPQTKSSSQPAGTPSAITSPKQHFGFNIGDDYCLANYQQLATYWAKLEGESDRLKVVKIGAT